MADWGTVKVGLISKKGRNPGWVHDDKPGSFDWSASSNFASAPNSKGYPNIASSINTGRCVFEDVLITSHY